MSPILQNLNKTWPSEMAITARERLARLKHLLADVLDKIPEEAFYLGTEMSVPDNSREIVRRIGKVPIGTCGAIGCAYGWAGVHPWFRARGLKTRVRVVKGDAYHAYHPSCDWVDEEVSFRFGRRMSNSVEWFGLTVQEDADLFYGDLMTTLAQTRLKVKRLIRKYSKPQPRNAWIES